MCEDQCKEVLAVVGGIFGGLMFIVILIIVIAAIRHKIWVPDPTIESDINSTHVQNAMSPNASSRSCPKILPNTLKDNTGSISLY
jgi:hypothetical protein